MKRPTRGERRRKKRRRARGSSDSDDCGSADSTQRERGSDVRSLDDLVRRKRELEAKTKQRRQEADRELAELDGELAAMEDMCDGALQMIGHGQPSAPTDSDSDSDLDGGDDSVVTMVDVWLGVFEPQRATWLGMNEALAAKKRSLGRLHQWRLSHHRQQLRRRSSNPRHVGEREVVCSLTDNSATLLAEVERRHMLAEYDWLCDAAGLPPSDGGATSTARRKRRLTDDKLSPGVLLRWVEKVAEERQALVRAASTSPPRPYAGWLADPDDMQEMPAPATPGDGPLVFLSAEPPLAAQPPPPFLGDDIFVLIAAELDARMLGRLGCAAQRFRRPSVPDPAHTADDPAPPEQWSVVEEGARRRLAAQSEQVRGWVCRGGVGGSWLRALGEVEKLQRPLRFTAHHEQVELSEEGTVVTVDSHYWRSAVCGDHEMRRGRHYATFTLRDNRLPSAWLGVVGASFDTNAGGAAADSTQGWMMSTLYGPLRHADLTSNWEGQPKQHELKDGDVVGLLLDLDAATLTVWVNGERKGVMVRPGMIQYGRPVGRLEGPLRWAVDVGRGSSVAITGPLPAPA